MKQTATIFLVTVLSFTVNAQISRISNQEIKDSLPSLIKKAGNVLSHAYMAQKLLDVNRRNSRLGRISGEIRISNRQ